MSAKRKAWKRESVSRVWVIEHLTSDGWLATDDVRLIRDAARYAAKVLWPTMQTRVCEYRRVTPKRELEALRREKEKRS